MDAKKIVLILGLLVALLAAFVNIPYVGLVLLVLGLVKGVIGVADSDRILFLVMAVALGSVAGSLDVVPELGHILTAILMNVSAFISAAALAVIGKMFLEKLTD
jgi:hypothetical protein